MKGSRHNTEDGERFARWCMLVQLIYLVPAGYSIHSVFTLVLWLTLAATAMAFIVFEAVMLLRRRQAVLHPALPSHSFLPAAKTADQALKATVPGLAASSVYSTNGSKPRPCLNAGGTSSARPGDHQIRPGHKPVVPGAEITETDRGNKRVGG